VETRLANGESLDAGRGRANYGKLMERLLLFRQRGLSFVPHLMKYAEEQLTALASDGSLRRNSFRVAVLGDTSGSMEVAINTKKKGPYCLSASTPSYISSTTLSFLHPSTQPPPPTCSKSPRVCPPRA